MKVRFFNSTMLAVLGWQTASAVEVSWYRQTGSAVSIASSASGTVWIAGTDRDEAHHGYTVYKWNGTEFKLDYGPPSRELALTNANELWVVNDLNQLSGEFRPGAMLWLRDARDVAAGGDNSVWIIGTDQRAGGYGVYQRAGATSWTYMNSAGVNIAVDKAGNAWVVNDVGEIRMYNVVSKTWESVPPLRPGAKARSIHTGATSGAVWMLGTDSVPGGYLIYQWDSSKRVWEQYGTYAAVEITEAAGVPWIVQSDGKLYSKAQPAVSTTTVNLTQTWPVATPQANPPIRVTQLGKLLCSSTAFYTDCTDTKADYVGKYSLDLSCDEGFYDPIYGGSCWKCPPGYDGRGAYIRSLTPVDSDTACWRSPKEATGSATKVRSPAWAWDCPAGSFWDGYSPDGIGGSCWQCPADFPRRTAAAVWASNACATAINETTRAIFLTYNGCPKPDASTMDLPGKRSPGKAFLDVAAGGPLSSTNGVCFSCPITDESGNFLIADRNTKSLYDKDANTGCTIKLKWQPAAFYDPGLAYLQGVKDVIWEQKLFDGTLITGFLYDQAEALGKGDATAEAKTWVAARWPEIASNPYNNDQFRAYMFVLLKAALAKDADKRTAGEKKLIKSFAIYIQQRRTYLAEQALAMYDAWKANDDLYRAQTGQTRSFSSLFYYGTVPLDFQGTLSGLMGVSAAGGGTIAALVAENQFYKSIEFVKDAEGDFVKTRTSNLYDILNDLKLLKTAQGLTAVAGAAIVQVAGVILTSIAIDQFVAIETARPKLLAALTAAKQAVDLNQLAASDNGEDMLYLYWSKAMDTWDQEDPQVVQLAAVAQMRAEQSGYAAPPKQ